MFLNVCSALFCDCARKCLIFSASVISGCILNILWRKFSKRSNVLFLPSKINLVLDTGFGNVAVSGLRWLQFRQVNQLND